MRPVEVRRPWHRLCCKNGVRRLTSSGYRTRSPWLAFIAAAVTFDCSSPTVPEVPLSTDVNLSATPGDIAPVLLSARPWRWRANWAVNLTAPEEVARVKKSYTGQALKGVLN